MSGAALFTISCLLARRGEHVRINEYHLQPLTQIKCVLLFFFSLVRYRLVLPWLTLAFAFAWSRCAQCFCQPCSRVISLSLISPFPLSLTIFPSRICYLGYTGANMRQNITFCGLAMQTFCSRHHPASSSNGIQLLRLPYSSSWVNELDGPGQTMT